MNMTQNFLAKNLRGHSFKDKNLTGANFKNADIQGADFTNAILVGANFNNTKAGLQSQWIIALVIVSLLLSTLSGFIAAWAGIYVGSRLIDSDLTYVSAREVTLIIGFAVFFFVTIRQGLGAGLRTVALAGVLVVEFGVALSVALTITGAETELLAMALAINRAGALAGVLAVAWAVVGILGGALAVALAVALIVALAGVVAGVVALAVALIVALAGAGAVALTVAGALAVAVVTAGSTTLLGGYVAWRALAGDKKFALIRRFVVAFAATGGTSFRDADLTDANFTQATLKNTNFSNAILKRTCWVQAKKVDLARVGGTILIDSAVQDLLVTGNGKNKSFVGLSLKDANLTRADLRDANLKEADISGAILQGACLEQANLTKTQALSTNFNGAKLTGACLEAWNIDSTTQLEGAICDYVYLLNNQRERRPSSGEFAPTEFTKLFQEVLHTVDLILRNGIDWEAFTYSFKKLQVENEDIELSIRSIENKGDGVVVVRVNVPADVNKVKIHSDFNQNYEFALKAIEERYQVELKSKDEQIAIYRQHQADLQEVVKLLASKPVNLFKIGVLADNKSKSVEGKLVVLKLGQGDFERGFPVTLQIGSEGTLPFAEITGELAAAPEILKQYNQWQTAYRKSLRAGLRIDVPATQVTNVSKSEFIKECQELAEVLRKNLNLWLNSEQFRSIRERLLEKLTTSEEIRVIWQTKNIQLRRIPWHLWDFFERYPKAEIALSTSTYTRVEKSIYPKAKVRILAILGNGTGIDLQKDREMLEQLPDAEVIFLVEPQRKELNNQLWFQPWDILFFAGHSSSQVDGDTGQIYINRTDSLSIAELKNALKKAIARGLQLAIFNSCDGLGLARELADLHIPQIIVMREPVPDLVAQEFLQHFLRTFAEGNSLYLAVREARERLQGLEDQFPCATWLPVICQNPAEVPTTWHSLRGKM